MSSVLGFPGGSVGKNLLAMQTWLRSLGQEDALEEEMAPTPVFLTGESHGPRSLAGNSPQGHKELGTTQCAHTHIFVIAL